MIKLKNRQTPSVQCNSTFLPFNGNQVNNCFGCVQKNEARKIHQLCRQPTTWRVSMQLYAKLNALYAAFTRALAIRVAHTIDMLQFTNVPSSEGDLIHMLLNYRFDWLCLVLHNAKTPFNQFAADYMKLTQLYERKCTHMARRVATLRCHNSFRIFDAIIVVGHRLKCTFGWI